MSETNIGSPGQTDISYQVMPNANGASNTPMPPPMPGASSSGGGGGKAVYIIVSIIVLLVLAGLAYYFLGFGKKADTTAEPNNQLSGSKLTSAFLQKYFAKDVCDDDSTCGDNADVDNDGINNYQELVAGTSPTDQDSDQDGIADGDEVNIYGTSPKEKYTDNRAIAKQNDFNDGASIKNGYDPLTPGDKFTETRLSTIQAKISQFQLHVPTTSTLGLQTNGTPVMTDTTNETGTAQ